MKTSRLSFLSSILALGGLLTAVAPASATLVTYTTTGVFSAGSTPTTNVFTDPTTSATATFNAGGLSLNTPGTDALGSITVSVPNNSSLTASGNFTLTVNQTVPSGGSQNFGSDAFSGTITTDASNVGSGTLVLTFSQTSITINGIVYTLQDLGQGGLASDQLGISNTGTTTIEAFITTPEPTFYGLTGLGFAGLLAMAIRRRQKATV